MQKVKNKPSNLLYNQFSYFVYIFICFIKKKCLFSDFFFVGFLFCFMFASACKHKKLSKCKFNLLSII